MSGHYLDFSDFTAAQTKDLMARAAAEKVNTKGGHRSQRLRGRFLMMLFERASTRTRTSFAAAIAQSGGVAGNLELGQSQLSRGESIADTARAVSSMCDAVVIRACKHETIAEFANYSACPVINGLSDRSHPCQVLADVMTYQEMRGELSGKQIAWCGDFNNVLFSWAQAASMFQAELRVACPPQYRPSSPPPGVVVVESAEEAVKDANLVMTDVWTSMGDEKESAERCRAFAGYSVSAELMKLASPDALFMHCLPAHRGEEVAAEVIDGEQSAVWTQAENRMHAQKALLWELIPGEDNEN